MKIALNRPEIHNAFNEELISEITSIFKNMTTQFPKSRCVILTGNGQSFSAGADLNWMKKMKDYTKEENEKSHFIFLKKSFLILFLFLKKKGFTLFI